jgi:hypothetical protein
MLSGQLKRRAAAKLSRRWLFANPTRDASPSRRLLLYFAEQARLSIRKCL